MGISAKLRLCGGRKIGSFDIQSKTASIEIAYMISDFNFTFKLCIAKRNSIF